MKARFQRLKTGNFGQGNKPRQKIRADETLKSQEKTVYLGQGQPKTKAPGPPGWGLCKGLVIPLCKNKKYS
jgi:hypothetical protein